MNGIILLVVIVVVNIPMFVIANREIKKSKDLSNKLQSYIDNHNKNIDSQYQGPARDEHHIKIIYAIDKRVVGVRDQIDILYTERISEREDIMNPQNYKVKFISVRHFDIPMKYGWEETERTLRVAIVDEQNKNS